MIQSSVHPRIFAMTLVLVVLVSAPIRLSAQERAVDLSPGNWPAGELEKFSAMQQDFGHSGQLATGAEQVIVGTTSALAMRAGREALDQGGTAADAALTASLTQIALAQGSWVSYAGIMDLVYFDAASGEVFNLNAAYNTVRGETDALTIPTSASGRTALVPGYMAGVEAAHKRFGKLPFAQLFEPAIYFADEGFTLTSLNARMLKTRHPVLSRLEETRRVFIKDNGQPYQQGEIFKQPALAKTLRAIAEQGADYMYRGPWAEKCVAAVQADGGKLSMDDMRAYQAQWVEPVRTSFGDYEVYANGMPSTGGVSVVEALHLMERANLKSLDHYSQSPEACFWLAQITNCFALSYLGKEQQQLLFGQETPLELRITPEFSETLWQRMQDGTFHFTQKPKVGDNHSDAIVVIDKWGNVAVVCHTSNTSMWGETGLCVDGICIPDSAAHQKELVARTTPGERLPDPTEPLLVMREGRPVYGLSVIGGGLHQRMICTLANLLVYDQTLEQSLSAPSLHLPKFDAAGKCTPQVLRGEFSPELLAALQAMGQEVIELDVDGTEAGAYRGYIVGAAINLQTGQRSAVGEKRFNAPALGK